MQWLSMTWRAPRADLGRAEPWLRGVGVAIWMFAGLSQWHAFAGGSWLPAWLLFGVALVVGNAHRRTPQMLSLLLLAAQTVAVVLMARAGLRGLEGLLLAIVVAQAPTVLPLSLAIAWALVQLVPLWVSVHAHKAAQQLFEIFGAYSTFSAFCLLVYWLYQQEAQTRRALGEANAALLATRAAAIENSATSERLRISRELHDSLGHSLTALRIQLELATQLGDPSEPLARARDIARDTIGEVRQVVSAMQLAQPLDFRAALAALAASIPSPAIHLDVPEVFAQQTPCATDLFRCAQEAITNALKHAHAANVWVRATTSETQLRLSIRDDGAGAAHIAIGHGLRGMRQRVTQHGGGVEFASDNGFAVELWVPR